jgi:hypothetical protein
MTDDFATAVKFTKLTHQNRHKEANGLVLPESSAARYLAHQTLINKAQSIGGYDQSKDEEPSIKPDPATASIKIKYAKTENGPALTYTWRDFTFEQGKLTGWTGASGPVQDVCGAARLPTNQHVRPGVGLVDGEVVVVKINNAAGLGEDLAELVPDRHGARVRYPGADDDVDVRPGAVMLLPYLAWWPSQERA